MAKSLHHLEASEEASEDASEAIQNLPRQAAASGTLVHVGYAACLAMPCLMSKFSQPILYCSLVTGWQAKSSKGKDVSRQGEDASNPKVSAFHSARITEIKGSVGALGGPQKGQRGPWPKRQ